MRIDKDEYYLQMAELVASRSTCLRRAVGCVLTNARGHVLATGHNGRPAGWPHCNEVTNIDVNHPAVPDVHGHACAGLFRTDGKRPHRSGTNLDACEAIHAEQNALLQCRDAYVIETCYVTVSPCVTCVKLLLNTSCRRVVFRVPYAHDVAAEQLWINEHALVSGEPRSWICLR